MAELRPQAHSGVSERISNTQGVTFGNGGAWDTWVALARPHGTHEWWRMGHMGGASNPRGHMGGARAAGTLSHFATFRWPGFGCIMAFREGALRVYQREFPCITGLVKNAPGLI